MIEIKEVTTKSELSKFVKFPDTLYVGNKYRVTPIHYFEKEILNRKKNPAFDYCEAKYWLAFKEGKIVGRIAAIINNKFVEIWGEKNGRFGWFDFIDDKEVSKALLDTAENWVKSKGMSAIQGPLGFTDMDMEGMLVEGFNEVGTMAVLYNQPYYLTHMANNGYTKDADWVQKEIKVPSEVPDNLERMSQIICKKYNVRPLKVKTAKELLPYAKSMFDTLNVAFKDLYGFVPLTDKQIAQYTKDYFSFIIPEFVCFVLNEKDEVVGFGVSMPSLSQALIKANGNLIPRGLYHIYKALKNYTIIDMYLNGVRPDYQGKGIHSIYYTELMKAYIKNGIKTAVTNPQLETNTRALLLWDNYEQREHLRHRSFIKHLS
ncbi:MAG: GNAT family N-acetyltransferase [Breznakibacter sp.]|nr:GNAT family N-acetyltransferase [Breznakibacter sp.]